MDDLLCCCKYTAWEFDFQQELNFVSEASLMDDDIRKSKRIIVIIGGGGGAILGKILYCGLEDIKSIDDMSRFER